MQLYSRKYISAQCIFLLCVCLAVEVASDPLKIVNFTYRTKQLGLIDQTITSNIISLELDQEVFHQVQCPIEFSEANRTTFVPCCATSPNVTGCYTPLADGYARDCIDGNGATNITITGTKTPDSYQRYSFKVSNYATCHSVSILTKAISGQVFLAVSIRPQFRSASLFVNDFLRVEYGSNGLSLCCSRIRELNPAWTGEVFIGWEAYVTTQFEFLVSTDPLLPVSEFYMLPPVEIQCDGLQFTAHECRERSGCFPTPAADDPMFALMKAIGGLEPYVAHPNRFATGITIRKDQFVNARISNVAFPFPESRFSDSSCIFTFPTLANNKSEVLGNAVGLPFLNDIPCDPVAFNETLTNFRNRITDLGNSSPRIYQETNEYFFRALFWVTSDAWTSCTDLVDEQLVRSLLKEVTIEDTNMCIESNRSETYLNDPCCNPDLQRTECCASRDVSGMVAGFEVASDAVTNTCETPRCVTNLLNDYITLSASTGDRRTGCAIRTTQAIGTGLNVLDDLQACIRAVNVTYCNSDAYCTGVDASSVCLPSGYCSIPCKTNEECATQVCEVVQGTARNITSCKFIDFTDVENLSSEIIMSTAWRCVEINVDPFSVLFVKQDLGMNSSSSRDEIVQTLVRSGGLPACFGANDDVPADQCNEVRACNWAVCNSLTDPYCNVENCTDPNLGSNYFCGACQSGFCAEVSTFPHCEYQNSATASDCAAVGGSFNGLEYKGIVNQKCIRPTTSQSECYPPQFCASSTCGARCYSPSRTSSNCALTSTNNVALQWQTWTVGGQNYSLCVTSSSYIASASCTGADPELSWWPGTKWVGGQLNTESQCQLLGLCSGNPTLKAICDNTKICTDGYSTNEQDCEKNGGCDDFNGCVFDWDPVDFSCAQSLDWTPLGCYSYIVSDPDMCASQGGRWLTRAASRAECESKAIVCREPKLAAVYNAVPTSRSVMQSEISLKNQSECLACDGVPVSYFSWTGGQWVPATFQPFEWRQRDFVRSNLYVAIPSYDYFYDVLSASLARRYAKSLESDLWCRFGQFSESVSNLVCDCAARGSDCFSGVSSSVVGVGLVCSYIPTNVSSDVAVIRAGDDLLIQGDDCINVRTSVMPMSQFTAKQVSSLSAAAVSSVKSQQRRSVLFIRNDAGIVVGQVISDGVKVDRDPQEFTGTLDVCLTFPTTFQAELQVAEYRWAVPNDDFTQFNLLDTVVNPGDITCFTIANVSQVYFPVGLQQSWQTADFVSTLFAGEIFFLVMGMVWYFAIFVFTGYHFVLHIMLRVPDAPFFNLSTTALLISMIFLINRFIYMVLILSGAMDQNPQVEVVFSSFPALLFYVVYSIIVIRWAEIYHFTMTAGAKRGISRLRPAIIALNVILVAAFILLIVLYFALQDYKPVIYSCATPEDQLTEKSVGDIVSIVYKAFFAAVSAVLSALFVIYGVRVLMLMRAATQKSTKTLDQKKSRENAFQRLMAVSSVCTVALLAQAIFLLWSSVTATNQDEGRFYGILTFLYLTEMPPAIIFVVMFKKASAFVKGSRNSMTTRQTASQTDQNSLQIGSATEEAGESQN